MSSSLRPSQRGFPSARRVLLCTDYQADWPLPPCPALSPTLVLYSHLIYFFLPLHLCMQFTPAWLTPNPVSISNVKLYELPPPTASHTGQAVEGPCLWATKALIPSLVMICFLVCHPLETVSSLRTGIMLSSSSLCLFYKVRIIVVPTSLSGCEIK